MSHLRTNETQLSYIGNITTNMNMNNILLCNLLFAITIIYFFRVLIDILNEKIISTLTSKIEAFSKTRNEQDVQRKRFDDETREMLSLYNERLTKFEDEHASFMISINDAMRDNTLRINNRVEHNIRNISNGMNLLDENMSGFSNKLHILILRMKEYDENYRQLMNVNLPTIINKINNPTYMGV